MQKRWEYPQEMRSLQKGTLTQSSKNKTKQNNKPPSFSSYPLWKQQSWQRYQCLWFPTRPLGILPPQRSRAPLYVATQGYACWHTHALAHTHTHTHRHAPPSPPCHKPWREMRREPWGPNSRATKPYQGSITRSSAAPTATPRHARRTTHSLSKQPSELPSHNSLTVFQPVQAHQPGVRSRLAFTSQFGFSFIVFGLDRISIAIRKGSV